MTKPAAATSEKLLQQISRGIDLLVGLQLQQVRGDRSTKDMILMLAGLGCSTPEIMRLLGAPRATVAPTVSRAKAANNGRKKKQAGIGKKRGKRR